MGWSGEAALKGRGWRSASGLLDEKRPSMGGRSIRLFRSEGATPTGGGRVSVSLGGRAVFHRVAASCTRLAPGLQFDRLKTAQALPQLALALNEGEKRRFVRVGFEVVVAEIVLVDGGHGLKVPSVRC
jgi:hypothetical protein